MLTMKQPFEEAKSKLGDKIIDIKSKTLYLHRVIDDISLIPITHAENILKEILKKEFFNQYIKVSQELEGCLGRLLLILDVVSSSGEDSLTYKSEESSVLIDHHQEVESLNAHQSQVEIDDNTHMAQMVPLTSPERTLNHMKNVIEPGHIRNYNNPKICNFDKSPNTKKFKKNSDKSTERVTCHLCGKTVRGNYELKVHLACRHTSESKSELKYVCMLCPTDPKRYARGDRLKEHIERIHLNISNKHICPLCGRGFNRPGRRNKHQMLCKGIDQDVEVIITEDNVLVSTTHESIEQTSSNQQNEMCLDDDDIDSEKMNNECEKETDQFYTETLESDIKEAISSDSHDSDASNSNEDGDTLHISEKETNNIPDDNLAECEVKSEDLAATRSLLNSSCCEENTTVHIISDRNSMVM